MFQRRSLRILKRNLSKVDYSIDIDRLYKLSTMPVNVTPTLFSEWSNNDSFFASTADHLTRFGCDIGINPDIPSKTEKYYMEEGLKHERRIIDKLSENLPNIIINDSPECSLENFRNTIQYMKEGKDLIAGAYLIREILPDLTIHGFADVLVKVDKPSDLGDYSYKVIEVKSSQNDKGRKYKLQAASYAWMLQLIQGVWPDTLEIYLDNSVISVEYSIYKPLLDEYTLKYMEFINQIKELVINSKGGLIDMIPFTRTSGSNHKLWTNARKQILEECDSIRSIWNMRSTNAEKLENIGIYRLDELLIPSIYNPIDKDNIIEKNIVNQMIQHIKSIESSDGGNKHRDIKDYILEANIQQAHAQKQSKLSGSLKVYLRDLKKLEKSLPEPNEYDVVYDIEGLPKTISEFEIDSNFQYLHGCQRIMDSNQNLLFWACSLDEEDKVFKQFVENIEILRTQSDNKMHIYVFNEGYEKNALKSLSKKYKIYEDIIKDWIDNNLIVDLYKIFKDNFVYGGTSYGLKNIEKLFRDARDNVVDNAMDSIIKRIEYDKSKNEVEREILQQEIENYNVDDLISTRELYNFIRNYLESQ